MRVVIFDTETSDFPERDGRLVQLAAHVCDISFEPALVVQEFSSLVVCPNVISPNAFAVHGISKDMTKSGVSAASACQWIKETVDKCDLVVAHNAKFDVKMMDFEFKRHDMGEFAPTNVFCTMMESVNICNIPGRYGKPKWPSLAEALKELCDEELVGAHDALADTRACQKIFMGLVKRGAGPTLK